MTGEEFRSRYELGEPIGRGRVTSFRARSAGGDDVMVHFLTGDEELDRPVLDRLGRSMAAVGRPEVRRRIDVDGRPVVVTAPISDFRSFEDWLEDPPAEPLSAPEPERSRPGSDPSAPSDAAGAGDADESGDFTRLFEAHGPDPDEDASAEASSRDPESPDAPSAEPPTSPQPPDPTDPSAETREFSLEDLRREAGRRPGRQPDAAAGSEPDAAAEPDEGPEPEPAEAAEADSGAVPDAAADEEPGEFTRLFRLEDVTGETPGGEAEPQPSPSDPPPSPEPPAAPEPPDPPRPAEPPQPPRPPEPPQPSPEAPSADDRPAAGPPPAPEPPADSQPSDKTGPGEFTQMFGVADTPPERPSDELGYRSGPKPDRESGERRSGSSGGGAGGGSGSDDYRRRLQRSADPPSSGPPPSPEPPSEAAPPAPGRSSGGGARGGAGGDASGGGSGGPGAFTRIVRGDQVEPRHEPSGRPAASESAPPPPPPATAGRRAPTWVWIAGFGGILAAAVLLVVLVLVLS